MMKKPTYLFTAESVSEGHPDKVADQISDAILDAYLTNDPNAKVAIECLITHQHLFIAGEVKTSSKEKVDVIQLAKNVIEDIGYTSEEAGFDVHRAEYTVKIHEQAAEINKSVANGGAGDQGMMFGYACDETEVLLPMPIFLAHRILEELARLRKRSGHKWLLPDSKSQVTVIYQDGIPLGIANILVSTQHLSNVVEGRTDFHGGLMGPQFGNLKKVVQVSQEFIRKEIINEVLRPLVDQYFPGQNPRLIINPSGSFTQGGPSADTGLTGRKIIVDTYGGGCPHGGGAFSGKDPSKVDRSAAYMARYVAKHLVAAGLAKKCTIQLAYAIGVAEPTSVYLDFHGTGKISEEKALALVLENFDLTPIGIIETLGLKRPIYQKTAAYGHFGRDGFPWEALNPEILFELSGKAV
jgi:S-adenosylmethionine synthetase